MGDMRVGDQRDYQWYIEWFNQAVQIATDLKNKMQFAWTVRIKSMECP